jgi:hypothetical protein
VVVVPALSTLKALVREYYCLKSKRTLNKQQSFILTNIAIAKIVDVTLAITPSIFEPSD